MSTPKRHRLRWPAMAIVAFGSIALFALAPQSKGTSTETVTLPLALPAPVDGGGETPAAARDEENVTPVTVPPSVAGTGGEAAPQATVEPVGIELTVDEAVLEEKSPEEAPATQAALEETTPEEAPAKQTALEETTPEEAPAEEALAEQTAVEAEAVAYTTESAEIGNGDSLYYIFKKRKLDPRELMMLIKAKPHGRKLERLMPGQVLEFTLDDTRSLVALDLKLDQTRTLKFSRNGSGFESELVDDPLERRTANAAGEIDDSLFVAGQRAGLSNKIIMELVEIFGWDIDFALDIRSGDSFLVVYEELYKDGEKVSDGNILAAEFVNQKNRYRAVRYQNPEGRVSYFTPDGDSMRKAFLRTPVKFGRVSSRFNLRRLHPVLHRIRAHRGVDYAAPSGTPVRASGDGKVILVGRKGGYGRTIILRHGSTYSTLYAHLRGYARGIRSGKRVQQGQVIGYVGRSGLATGTHLHYEFRVRGVHRNPLTVKLPKAAPVPTELKADFELKTRDLVAQLDVLSRTRIALSE